MTFCSCQKMIKSLLFFLGLLGQSTAVWALAPEEVAVIANVRAADSLELAEYYLRKRHIPLDNLVRISTTWNEHCSRADYNKEIRKPVQEGLARIGKTSRIRCLVVMYGVPLAIRPLDPGDDQPFVLLQKRLQALKTEQEAAKEQRLAAILAEKQQVEQQIAQQEKMDSRAAVDSELALVLAGDYPLEGWLPNPYFLGFHDQKTLLTRDAVLMVSRLDGPNPETVRRLVDDALLVEKTGLRGRAYFDARWPKPDKKEQSGYALYDAALHAAAEGVRKSGRMEEVRLDARSELFQPGEAPDAALYCGWYSLGHYVDAFSWVRGAIGYHIASGECATLKQPGSQVWCKRLLEEGVAATVGPVYEPYVQAFPLPNMFFQALTEGYLSLAESYLVSLPYLSWQMVLIGDPLYQPFAPK
jgi:uncharacterized protein (TIGR03790 family)